MDIVTLRNLSSRFREAIRQAQRDKKFHWRDRMSGFPSGCCDDACDLLGFYLKEKYGINTFQRNGRYEIADSNHVWLKISDDVIVDITGDQFNGWQAVYVGPECGYYDEIKGIKNQDNFDIRLQRRLWQDYQIIMEYMK